MEEAADEVSMDVEHQAVKPSALSPNGSMKYSVRRRKSSTSSVNSRQSRSKSLSKVSINERKSLTDEGKLINEETAEEGSVKLGVYFNFLKAIGPWGAVLILACYVIQSVFTVYSSLWLSWWSDDTLYPDRRFDPALRDKRLGVYGALGVGESTFSVVVIAILFYFCIKSSQSIHDQMLARIMRAPMSFFDTTPLGRILNRFTKDIDTIDIVIRFNLRAASDDLFRAVITFILMACQSLYFLIAFVPLSIIYYIIQVIPA